MLGILFISEVGFGYSFLIAGDFRQAQAAVGARPLNVRGSTYNPGGEPAPLMVWLPTQKVATIGIRKTIEDALVCFEDGPKSVEQSARRCNHHTQCSYEPGDRIKVAVGRDDMQKIVD